MGISTEIGPMEKAAIEFSREELNAAFRRAMEWYEKDRYESMKTGGPLPTAFPFMGLDYAMGTAVASSDAFTKRWTKYDGTMNESEYNDKIETLEADLVIARKLLQELNIAWLANKRQCPICGQYDRHESDCLIIETINANGADNE